MPSSKVTPGHGDITWYLKWIATVFILIGISIRTTGELPLADLLLTSIGTVLWGVVAFKWRDKALLVVNSVALVLMLGGILRYLLV
jgi:hypothetical protein